jgi:glycosyltransferase involved in cell wall biosynthesis
MKILWVKTGFLHPTTRGGDIRTLEMLKHLHARHEVHYAAPSDPSQPEGLARCHEYCSAVHSRPYQPARKPSPAFFVELLRGVAHPLPVSIFRWRSAPFARLLADLLARERFDRVVCDFLVSAVNLPTPKDCVLFQHNVETMIWRRLAGNERHPLKRAYLRAQAARMFRYERAVCRAARRVVAVSDVDAELMRDMYGIERVASIPTGVDTEYFARPAGIGKTADLVFLGSMDYLPNIEGVRWFVREILPLIHVHKPDCTLAVVGRQPPAEILNLAEKDPRIRVTGTVPDVRPYLWGAPVSVVPLLSGGGTRLKIYESMAAGTAVVSTKVGAEGLIVNPPRDIRLADDPGQFALECLELLGNAPQRHSLAEAALRMVELRFSWERVCLEFEELLS